MGAEQMLALAHVWNELPLFGELELAYKYPYTSPRMGQLHW